MTLLHSFQSEGQTIPTARLLTKEEAFQIVMQAIPKRMKKLPGFSVEAGYTSHLFANVIFFDAFWRNPFPGSGVAGHFSVNLKTGDVCEPINWDKITNSKLMKVQKEMRRRIGLTDSIYHQLREDGICYEREFSGPQNDSNNWVHWTAPFGRGQ
jgi:hypothetical protein